MKLSRKIAMPIVGLGLIATLTGCIKPYDTPEFVEIKPNQTAFVIPLEGKTSDQGKFESEKYLEDAQVAAKRIEVPHKWVQTGRRNWKGEWMDTIRVIVVDRNPQTRQWAGDKAYVGESKDSVKFDQGISATAQIKEDNSAKYLYENAGKSLKSVMDNQIRDYIGSVLLEEYSKKTIEEIRGDKSAILNSVKAKVVPYFEEKGITISNLGYVDDMKYLDPAIQTAINKKFNAEEDQKAQTTMNQTEIDKATAEAEANRIRKESMEEILDIKELEIKQQWIEKWDGKLPQVQSGEGSGQIISVPKPE